MKIAFDLDGVFCNFTACAADMIRERYIPDLPIGYLQQTWSCEDILTTEQWNDVFSRLMAIDNFWTNIPAYDENVEALRDYLQSHDENDIYFITSRGDCAGGSARSMTQLWLMDHGLPIQNLIVVKSGKEKEGHLRSNGIQMFIDDLAPTIAQCLSIEGCCSVLLDREYNRYAAWLPRVMSVAEFLLEATFASNA